MKTAIKFAIKMRWINRKAVIAYTVYKFIFIKCDYKDVYAVFQRKTTALLRYFTLNMQREQVEIFKEVVSKEDVFLSQPFQISLSDIKSD